MKNKGKKQVKKSEKKQAVNSKKTTEDSKVKYVPAYDPLADPTRYQKVFHGSDTAILSPDTEKSGHQKPKDPKKANPVWEDDYAFKDFGKGFYVTSSYQQAVSYAKGVATKNKSKAPTVTIYGIDSKKMVKEMKVLIFTKPCVEWFDFLLMQHQKGYDHGYDIVIGPVADGKTSEILKLYRADVKKDPTVDKKKYIEMLKPNALKDQILFHTQASTKYLIYFQKRQV